jgi:predicted nucleotidyltransferase
MSMLESLNLTGNEILALTELTKAIRRLWPLARITLFGSKATGTFDAESDVDVLVLLPCPASEAIRKQIVHKVFEINLAYESNISVLIVSEEEWDSSSFSFLPIHAFIEKEGVAL